MMGTRETCRKSLCRSSASVRGCFGVFTRCAMGVGLWCGRRKKKRGSCSRDECDFLSREKATSPLGKLEDVPRLLKI